MALSDDWIAATARDAPGRLELWTAFLHRVDPRVVAEIGVYRGAFAAHVLAACPGIGTYYMLDPWRRLEDWNKPANRDDSSFERIFEQAMRRTEEHAERRVVLRGRTTEVVERIPDGHLDFAYVDADHTLRGIALDLIRIWPKVHEGGWIGGDDFGPSIWQHGDAFEPSLVFPFTVHFAEAAGCPIYALPHRQFLIEKTAEEAFRFVDLTGKYRDVELLGQVSPRRPASPSPGAGRARRAGFLRRARKLLGRGGA